MLSAPSAMQGGIAGANSNRTMSAAAISDAAATTSLIRNMTRTDTEGLITDKAGLMVSGA